MAASTKLVTDFIAAFNRRDIDGIMDFFTEDSVYHSLPIKPVTGLRAIRETVQYFIEPAQEVSWKILNIADAG
jgi:limonene-1,2-epoxide hydrolase